MQDPIPSSDLRKVNMQEYLLSPSRYTLISGDQPDAPPCPYGNRYRWIGYDLDQEEYVRFTKSVFKHLINRREV